MTSTYSEDQVIAELGFAVDEYFGGCPECGKQEGVLNIGRDHWAVCDTHKNKWPIGSNVFSSWRDETERVWARNERRLADYINVKPLLPTDPGSYGGDEFYQAAMSEMLTKLRERRRLVEMIGGAAS